MAVFRMEDKMVQRYKKMGDQLGKNISHVGSHMPTVAVGILRKRRIRKVDNKELASGGSKVKPLKEYNPYPTQFNPST